MGTFSSFFSHHIATMEGGCIVTDDEEIYHILLALRAHGWTRNLPKNNRVTGVKSENSFDESFHFVLPGYNLRPLEMSAAVGQEQLKKLPSFISQRRDNAKYFQELFSNHPIFSIQKEVGASSWFGFSLILKEDSPFDRKLLLEKLGKGGVECRPIVTGNFLKNDRVLRFFDYEVRGSLINAEYLDKNGLFVGNHHVDIKPNIAQLFKLLRV
jgi:CDP-6-deoxy-D-xylo-4-hexulose-3-dehydrase